MSNYIKLIKNTEEIVTDYNHLDVICREIIRAYLKESSNNRTNYENFSQNYHSFYPYLEFVLMELGYIYANEILFTGFIKIEKEDNDYYLTWLNEKIKIYKCDDINLAIHQFAYYENINHQGFIDKRGNVLSNLFINDMVKLASMLVSQHLMYDVQKALEFYEYRQINSKNCWQNFCWEYLGYIELIKENENIIMYYNDNLITPEQNEVIRILKKRGVKKANENRGFQL